MICLVLFVFGNFWLIFLKEILLVLVIGLFDFVCEVGIVVWVIKEFFLFFGFVCLIYLVFVMILFVGFIWIECWFKWGDVV